MYRLLTVAVSIAGLVVCPAVCWVEALAGCPDGHGPVDEALPKACCGACGAAEQPAGPDRPAPRDPSDRCDSDCICKGGTVAAKHDGEPRSDGGPVAVLPALDALLAGHFSCVATKGAPWPLAHAPPGGRALRILLQSFLA